MPVKAAAGGRTAVYRGEPMKHVTRAALASLALIGPAQGADLFGTAPPPTLPASQAPTAIEIGSNWYLRGDIGASFDRRSDGLLSPISVPPASGQPPFTAGTAANAYSTDFDGGARRRLPLQRLSPLRRDLGLSYRPRPEPLDDRHLPLLARRPVDAGKTTASCSAISTIPADTCTAS